MSKFQKYMVLYAVARGADLPYELVREAIYGK